MKLHAWGTGRKVKLMGIINLTQYHGTTVTGRLCFTLVLSGERRSRTEIRHGLFGVYKAPSSTGYALSD